MQAIPRDGPVATRSGRDRKRPKNCDDLPSNVAGDPLEPLSIGTFPVNCNGDARGWPSVFTENSI